MDRMLRIELPLGFLEGHVQDPFAAAAGGIDEMGGQAGLAGPRRAGDQDAGAPIIASAAQHRVQPRHAAGDPLVGGRVPQAQRGDRQDGDAVLVDQERAFVGAVAGAAVLDDPQPPGGDLLRDAMIQDDHAIGDIFFQPVPGERAVAPFRR